MIGNGRPLQQDHERDQRDRNNRTDDNARNLQKAPHQPSPRATDTKVQGLTLPKEVRNPRKGFRFKNQSDESLSLGLDACLSALRTRSRKVSSRSIFPSIDLNCATVSPCFELACSTVRLWSFCIDS